MTAYAELQASDHATAYAELQASDHVTAYAELQASNLKSTVSSSSN
jgi:hypothetical protein